MSKVAKNTGLLYVRSIIILIITLYSSRVLLSTLGVDDYGLYNLVGGVVGLFASLKGLFAFAVQRFLSFAKGESNIEKERDVFTVSFYLHIGIALIFALVVECFGLWFIANKLNIPDTSIKDAYFVFHCSVITAVVSIILTPYSASVIANEKMNVYAWISIVDAVIKLSIILLLPFIPYASVRCYAVLLLSVEMLNLFLYYTQCLKFKECKLVRRFNKSLFKELATFAGWDFAGNTAWALINEGVNMILNVFGGVAINAARGVAYQVKNAVIQLVNNVMVASRPYIIKQAASEDKDVTFKSIFLMGRALFIIMSITSLPLIVYADRILSIWLVETPNYAVSFVQLVLVWNIVRTMNTPIDLAFTAYGKMKRYQIYNSLTLLLNLPIAYIFLNFGYSFNYAMLTFVIVEVIDIAVNLIIAKKEVSFDIIRYLKTVILPNIFNAVALLLIGYLFYLFLEPTSILATLMYMAFLVLITLLITLTILLSKEEKDYIYPVVLKLFNKIKIIR